MPGYIPGKACDTSFRYVLDERGRITAERGLKNFYQCVAHVLAFNRKFESIIVTDRRQGQNQKYLFYVEAQIALSRDIDVFKIHNGKKGAYDYLIVSRENHNLQISIGIDQNNKVLPRPDKDPVLYADFPLIGSHDFPFPCQINSHIFWPDEERSSVILSHSQ